MMTQPPAPPLHNTPARSNPLAPSPQACSDCCALAQLNASSTPILPCQDAHKLPPRLPRPFSEASQAFERRYCPTTEQDVTSSHHSVHSQCANASRPDTEFKLAPLSSPAANTAAESQKMALSRVASLGRALVRRPYYRRGLALMAAGAGLAAATTPPAYMQPSPGNGARTYENPPFSLGRCHASTPTDSLRRFLVSRYALFPRARLPCPCPWRCRLLAALPCLLRPPRPTSRPPLQLFLCPPPLRTLPLSALLAPAALAPFLSRMPLRCATPLPFSPHTAPAA